MRVHEIKDGKVANTIEVGSLGAYPNLVEATAGGIGWHYADGVFKDPNAISDSELAANEAGQAKSDLKLTGIEIMGVMCSATKDDRDGLVAVALDHSMAVTAGEAFEDTNFKFANGNSLLITADNFTQVSTAWRAFRRSFFTPK